MNGIKCSQVVVALALSAMLSNGCATSRGRGCRDGKCRVSSGAESVSSRRTNEAKIRDEDDTPRGYVQLTCPVTGEKLGSMGTPIPVRVEGKSIQVCCDGCVAAVEENPKKYLTIVEDEIALLKQASAVRRETFNARAADSGQVSRSSGGCRSCR